MQLLVQPDDGIGPILTAIRNARRTIDLHVFRLASNQIEKALADAVKRGVEVRTLIAHTHGGKGKALRKLELRLLKIGATVSRSGDDLLRYHGKILIVDAKKLYVLAYNLTRSDIGRARSLGIATRKRDVVAEAAKVFDADFDRKPYTGDSQSLIVSPVNARERLSAFLRKARKELLIYGSVTDGACIRILKERMKAGVLVRIIGRLRKGHEGFLVERYPGKRMHLRAIVRDGRAAFVGSQILRKPELDARREIGVIVKHAQVVKQIAEVFAADWAQTEAGKEEAA
ncbi:MAG TPA: phospholipase D-like domain-containing protein [Vicinamibacteria bacterium]|nr:phospholipase D-like domain-containing protein [Vicinamibacteria bacterium]